MLIGAVATGIISPVSSSMYRRAEELDQQYLRTGGGPLSLSSGSLWLLATSWPGAGRLVEVAVLVVANAAATLLRFLALRLMMHPRQQPSGSLTA